jgi:hypothetical protein
MRCDAVVFCFYFCGEGLPFLITSNCADRLNWETRVTRKKDTNFMEGAGQPAALED